MRDMQIFLLTIFLFSVHALQIVCADSLEDARDRLVHGEYESAVTLYGKHLESAPPSADIFFELGQALQKSNKEADAALAYRRCLILDPAFGSAAESLQQVNARLGIPALVPAWQARLARALPMDAAAVFGAVFFWLGAFLLLGILIFPKNRIPIFFTALTILMMGLSLCVLTLVSDPRITESQQALVMNLKGVSLYKVPSEDDAEKITTLNQGSVVKILNSRGRWVHVEVPGGQRGWSLQSGMTPLIPSS